MADIQVDVTLPSATSVDVTSPTQALAANVVIPGPQGPRGLPTAINGLSNANIYLSGVDGVKIFNSGVNTIFVSGSGNYFISSINNLTTNLNLTGSNLQTQIDNLDLNYATDAQLQTTGSTLTQSINSLSGTLTDNYYLKSNPSGFITGVDLSSYLTSSTAATTYATINNLQLTGSTLQTQINNLGDTYATDTELSNVQTNLNNKITSLSGDAVLLKGDQIIQGQKTFTGSNVLIEKELYVYGSGYFPSGIKIGTDSVIIDGNTVLVNNDPVALISELNQTGATISSNITSLSGSSVLSYGEQVIEGVKIFSGSNVALNVISGASLTVSGNPVLTGVDLTPYATNANLAQTGSSLQNQINNLDNTYATDSALASTGSTLVQSINSLNTTLTNDYYLKSNPSGFITGVDLSSYLTSSNASITYATISNLALTGSNLQNQINNFDNTYATDIDLASTGSSLQNQINNLDLTYATDIALASTGLTLQSDINTLNTNLFLTGSGLQNQINNLGNIYATDSELSNAQTNLDNKINSLSGSSVLLYGNQTIDGTKTFRNSVYIHDLYVTGTEFIATTENNFIQSPYLLLNLTGGAVDGGIFFVTGSGLTGINDIGPIIGFDHTDKFKFGISSRGADLSTLNDIASVQQIQAYSGFVDGKYATIINLASTGSTLQTQIDNLGNTYATVTNLANTGSALDSKINSLSGTLTSDYATVANLASTGSTLDNKVNILSGFSVLTFGDQTISGKKTFIDNINVSGTGTFNSLDLNNVDNLSLSGIDISITGSTVNVYGNILISGNPVLTGVDLSSYATISNLASTGSTLQTNINNLSGVSVLTFGNQTINGTKTFNSGVVINVQPTGTNPALSITGTWNNASEIYTGIHLDITDTNSNSTSTFLNLRTNGISRLRIRKDGAIFGRDAGFGSDDGFSFGDQAGGAISCYSASLETLRISRNVNPAPGIVFTRSLGGMTFSEGHALYSQGANIIGQSNGSNPQSLRIFNATGTNSGEFGLFGWQNNQLRIGSQATSSGISRDVLLTGNNVLISGNNFNIAQNGQINILPAQDLTHNFAPASNTAFLQAGALRLNASATTLALRRGGTDLLTLNNSNEIQLASTSPLQWNNDTYLYRDAANTLAQRNAANAQQFRVYNATGTNSGEFGLLGWQNNQLFIGAQKTNSGILRDIVLSGANINLYAMGDGTVQGGQLQMPYNTDYNSLTFRNTQSNVNYLQLKRYLGASSGPLLTTLGFTSSISTNSASSADILLERDAAGILAQRNAANAQQFRVYNITGTNTGEFALFGWQNNNLIIGSQQSQSGILRDMTLTGRNININASGVFNIFDNTNIIGNLTVSGNTTITGHLSAASKSFLIDHPTQIGKKLQYGSLESPYHGIRLTDRNKLSADSVKVNLPDYISALVNDEKVNIQLTNINHDKILFVKDVNVNENYFTVGMNRGWFDKNEYEFYWSFTAERKDIPKLTVEF